MVDNQSRRESDAWEAVMMRRLGLVVSGLTATGMILSGAWWFGAQAAKEETTPMNIKISNNETRIESVESKQSESNSRAVRFEAKMDTKLDKITDLIIQLRTEK